MGGLSGNSIRESISPILLDEDIYQLIFNSVDDLIILIDSKCKIKYINNAASKFFNKDSDDLLNKDIWKLFPSNISKQKQAVLQKIIKSMKPYQFDVKKTDRWYDFKLFPMFNKKGSIIQFCLIARDITTREEREEHLQESEEKYRAITETVQEVICITDLDGQFIFMNRAGLEIGGFSEMELLQKNVSDIIAPEDFEMIQTRIKKRIQGDKDIHVYEAKFINQSGERIPFEISTAPLMSKGELKGIIAIARDIHERKQMESAYQTVVQQSLLGILIYNRKRILFANQAAADILGYTVDELIRMPSTKHIKFIPVDERSRLKKDHQDRLRGNLVPAHFQQRIIRKDGYVCWIEVTANLIDYRGESAFQVFIIDVTDKIEAQDALKESEEKYRKVTEAAQDIIFTINKEGKFTFINKSGSRILGYSKEEILEKNVMEVIAPEYLNMIKERLEKRIAGNEKTNTYDIEVFNKKEAKRIPVEVCSTPLKSGNDLIGVLGVVRDISERKRMESAYKSIVEQSLLGICVLRNAKLIFANKAIETITGYSTEELLNMSAEELMNLVYPDDRELADRHYRNRNIEVEIPSYYQHRIICKNGDIRWLQVTHNLVDYHGQPAVQVFIIDVTDKIKAENALRESDARYRSFVQHFRGIAYRGNIKDWSFIFIHGDVEEITGYKEEEFIIKKITWDKLIHPEDFPNIAFSITAEKIRTERDYGTEREYRIIRKDKQIRWIYESCNNICDKEGKPYFIQGALYDITDKKKLEEELFKSQKLESIGILAGGIAHDFNNLLTGIMGNLSLAAMHIRPQEDIYELLKDAEKASLRARDLAAQLLTFSRGGLPVKTVISLKELIKDTIHFAVRGTNIKCKYNLEDDLLPVEVDEGQIGQVINNIIINAIQSMPKSGVIQVSAKNCLIDSGKYLPLVPGKYIIMTIKDDGRGISQKDLPKIFDPYFSTKKIGSGLGLTISYSIIKKHSGHISVESKLHSGTSFHIYLPVSEKKITRKRKSTGEKITGKGKILIMDDEQLILNLVKKILEKLGYQVELALDGREAIKKFKKVRSSGAVFDVVILDLTVPGGMGGKETIDQLLQIDPDVKAILSSGYSDDVIIADYKEYGFSAVIIKPYNANQLGELLRKVMHK